MGGNATRDSGNFGRSRVYVSYVSFSRDDKSKGGNGAKEMQLEIAETSVGAGYMFPK